MFVVLPRDVPNVPSCYKKPKATVKNGGIGVTSHQAIQQGYVERGKRKIVSRRRGVSEG